MNRFKDPCRKKYDSRGRPIDISTFKIFENHDDHKNQNSPEKPKTIPNTKSLFSLQPLGLQSTDTYSDQGSLENDFTFSDDSKSITSEILETSRTTRPGRVI